MAGRIPDPTLMARLQLSVKGVDWAASLVRPYQHQSLDGGWTPHQHLYHLLGQERVFQERIARVLAEDEPALQPWDGEAHMAQHRPEPDILELADQFMAERAKTFETLRAIREEDWLRTAVWPDGRRVDLAWIAERALWHALDHFAALLNLHGRFEPLQARRWREESGTPASTG